MDCRLKHDIFSFTPNVQTVWLLFKVENICALIKKKKKKQQQQRVIVTRLKSRTIDDETFEIDFYDSVFRWLIIYFNLNKCRPIVRQHNIVYVRFPCKRVRVLFLWKFRNEQTKRNAQRYYSAASERWHAKITSALRREKRIQYESKTIEIIVHYILINALSTTRAKNRRILSIAVTSRS